MINGIILMNKPKGFTSFDVIAKMRGILRQKKLGHSGTLDPMATGVLPVFAGSATKAISIIPKSGKSYRADFRLGRTTDTYDITGTVTDEQKADIPKQQMLEILENFRGNITQLPPMYSAVSVGGKRLYDLARKGIEVERPERQVTVSRLELTSFDEASGEGTLEIDCSQGTYVRSIIHDMGKALGCGAVMTDLLRTKSDGFLLEDCVTIEELEKLRDEGKAEAAAIPVERLFSALPEIRFSKKQTFLYKNGVKQSLEGLVNQNGELFRVYGNDDSFIGIARADREENVLRVCKNLSGDSQ